jgi:glucose-6-phosphate dehydrogenase assembly protein OpcA
MDSDILSYVLRKLEETRGQWPAIARASGVPYDTITKIAQRQIEDPKVNKVQRLANYFRLAEAPTDHFL